MSRKHKGGGVVVLEGDQSHIMRGSLEMGIYYNRVPDRTGPRTTWKRWEIIVDIERLASYVAKLTASKTRVDCDPAEVSSSIDVWVEDHGGKERGRFAAAAVEFGISAQTAARFHRLHH
ncbi:MAG: hypothetical protein E2O54_07640 [Gammaproteobacteria bacterium]|nr:MAG: hypothetical protein E2O54_07640 [Gammaproteobacteria bacterium]